jgi:hypothetical protein
MLSRNVGKDYHSTLRNTPEERRSQEQNWFSALFSSVTP